MLPPLNALRCFEAVARLRSYNLAAAELCVTSSAVSHQVRTLEDHFGLSLTVRDGRGFELTKEGVVLKDDLETAFALIKRGSANVLALNVDTPLGFSVPTYFASNWLANRLHRFWEMSPKFGLRFFHIRDSDDPIDFTDPNVHLAAHWDHKDNRTEEDLCLVQCDLTPACSPELLENRLSKLSPADLVSHSILHGESDLTWKAWLKEAAEPDLIPKYYEYYEDENVRINAAIRGEGFALVCRKLSKEEIKSGRLVCPFDISLVNYGYYLNFPSGREHNPNMRKFVNWLKSEVKRK